MNHILKKISPLEAKSVSELLQKSSVCSSGPGESTPPVFGKLIT